MSLGSACLSVAIVSVMITGFWCCLRRDWTAGYVAIGVPLILSFLNYFAGGSSPERSAWAFIGVGAPFLAGLIPSSIVAALFDNRRGK